MLRERHGAHPLDLGRVALIVSMLGYASPSLGQDSSGVRFDEQGNALYEARVRRCDGDGCSDHFAAQIDVRSGRITEYQSHDQYRVPDPRYDELRRRYEASQPAPNVAIREGYLSAVVTLRSVLPGWTLRVTRDVLRLVDPTNQHTTVLARRVAEGEGRCSRGEECVSCPGQPSIDSVALSPDGTALLVEISVHEPECDCHNSVLARPPIHVRVARMRAFARTREDLP